jgi:hypothetical protein
VLFVFVNSLEVLVFVCKILLEGVLFFKLLFSDGSDIGDVKSPHFINDGVRDFDWFFPAWNKRVRNSG